jgi:hypothetical protein
MQMLINACGTLTMSQEPTPSDTTDAMDQIHPMHYRIYGSLMASTQEVTAAFHLSTPLTSCEN